MRTRHLLLVLATVSLAILLTGCQKPDAESSWTERGGHETAPS